MRAMNEMFLPPLAESLNFASTKIYSLIQNGKSCSRVRQLYGGYHVLSELLEPPLAELVTVVGVATDDITQPFVHADVRLWKYPHTPMKNCSHRFAAPMDFPFTPGAEDPEFQRTFVAEWKPTCA